MAGGKFKMTVKLEGGKELERALKRANGQMLQAFKAPVQATTSAVLAASVSAAPSDDGELKASAVIQGTPEMGPRKTEVFSSAGFTADHAPFVEVGVHNGNDNQNTGTRGYSFMRAAAKPLRSAFKKAVKSAALTVLKTFLTE